MKNNEINKFEGIVVPPNCDNSLLHNCGEKVSTFSPASYNPNVAAKYLPHQMSGHSGAISVPKTDNLTHKKTMSGYLSKFVGANVCLDLWASNHMKIKKCGIITEVSEQVIVMRDTYSKNISIIDLKPIQYINIYCR